MSSENTAYDDVAQYLYNFHRQHGWPAFYNMPKQERDYWRAQAQVCVDGNYWPSVMLKAKAAQAVKRPRPKWVLEKRRVKGAKGVN